MSCPKDMDPTMRTLVRAMMHNSSMESNIHPKCDSAVYNIGCSSDEPGFGLVTGVRV